VAASASGRCWTVFRSNRAEFLGQRAWPTATASRIPPGPWADGAGGRSTPGPPVAGLANRLWPVELAHRRQPALFPFPAATSPESSTICWGRSRGPIPRRATNLVWPLLELLARTGWQRDSEPALLARWLERATDRQASTGRLALGRGVADSFDDLSLYRPDLESAWLQGLDHGGPRRCPPPCGLEPCSSPPP